MDAPHDTQAGAGLPADDPNPVVRAYARRAPTDRYSMLQPDVWQTHQERQRAMLRLWRSLGWHDLSTRYLFEVGCGAGGNLLDFLRMGFAPAHLAGAELLPARCALARQVLPPAVALVSGEAASTPVAAGSQDVVFQGTVFSSLPDDAMQQRLADAMWRWVKPGGGVLWYDMRVDNPRNPDVRGVPLRRVAALFPQARLQARRVTLAPPLARLVSRWHPAAYTLANALPLLRTHLFVWIEKPADPHP